MLPFSQQSLDILKKTGYHFIVVDKAEAVGYAYRESTKEQHLKLLSLREFDIDSAEVLLLTKNDVETIVVPE
jgi:hypothetical protein